MRGLTHIYCGDGKGKTTAALGLGLRAAGAGYTVIAAQFLKSSDTAELSMLEQLGITVLRVREPFGFTWELSSGELERLTLRHNEVFRQAVERCGDGEKTLLILDELAAALNTGTIDKGMVSWALQHKPEALELVVTGREPPQWLTDMADYITEMRNIRHPMEKGVDARRGIEY